MHVTIPKGSYAGFGWGASMENTEMVIFSTKGATGSVQTYYSPGFDTPNSEPTLQSCYSTSQSIDGNNYEFVTTRPLDCNVADSYVIRLDVELSLISAWSPTDDDLAYHDKNYIEFKQLLSPKGTCKYVDVTKDNSKYYEAHGLMMWFAWTIIGLAQVYLNRYMKHKWRWNKLVHGILGIFSMALVIAAGVLSLNASGWKINSQSSKHSKAGFVMLIMGLLLMLGGIFAGLSRRYMQWEWKTKWIIMIGGSHKYFGFAVLIGSQVAIYTGLMNFYKVQKDKDSTGQVLAIIQTAFFFVMLIAGEVVYQLQKCKKKNFDSHDTTMSREEFDSCVTNGQKLVLLDDLVLDVDKFIGEHPGGKFFLIHNIGRDISKYYYGGYSLEGNGGARPAKGHTHTTYADRIIKELAIARYLDSRQVATTRCRVREDLTQSINTTTKLIVFENCENDNEGVVNFKTHYPNNNFLANHFLITDLKRNNIARHYTICNTMRPHIYQAYIKALKNDKDPDHRAFNRMLLDDQDSQ